MSDSVLEDMERKRMDLLELIEERESGRMISTRNTGALVVEWKTALLLWIAK